MAWRFAYASEKYNLVYVEQQGCFYCEIWDEEIAAIYPKTPEGKFAPLLRLDITNYETEMSDVKPVGRIWDKADLWVLARKEFAEDTHQPKDHQPDEDSWAKGDQFVAPLDVFPFH